MARDANDYAPTPRVQWMLPAWTGPESPQSPVKTRACSWSGCGKVLHAAAGFIEVTRQPTGDLESYCSLECLHWQLHEELR